MKIPSLRKPILPNNSPRFGERLADFLKSKHPLSLRPLAHRILETAKGAFVVALPAATMAVGLMFPAPLSAQVVPQDKLIGAWEFNTPGADAPADLGTGTIELLGNATFTGDAQGQTEEPGDFALSFGNAGGALAVLTMDNTEFWTAVNEAAANDTMSVVFWQRWTDTVRNSSTVWFNNGAEENLMLGSAPGQRNWQHHTPWGNSTIYFDTSGCCTAGATRISANISTFDTSFDFMQWHHFAFIKNGETKQIWIDGQLFLEGTGDPLMTDFGGLRLGGGDNDSADRYLAGDIDDLGVFSVGLTPEAIMALANRDEPLALAPELRPPNIAGFTPENGTLFYPADGGISFTVSTHPDNSIDSSDIHLDLNGVDVTGSLSIEGASPDFSVSYTDPLDPDTQYTATVMASDNMGRVSTRAFKFDTFNSTTSLVVEAEDYNFGPNECDPLGDPVGELTTGGQYIQNPLPSFFNGVTSSYVNQAEGYVDRVGIPEVDFHDASTAEFTDPDLNVYRFCNLVGTQSSNDARRQKYIDASLAADANDPDLIPDFNVNQLQAGEWLNYTRTFTEGNYRAYLRASASADQTVRLDQVASDPAQGGQQTELMGNFNISTDEVHGFQYIPLSDVSGEPIILSLSGEMTVRLTAVGADDNLNLNYLLFLPTDESASVLPPLVVEESLFPAPDETEAPRDATLTATILNRGTSVVPDSIALFVDDVEVNATITPNADGADVSYAAAFEPGTEHTARLEFSDNEGSDLERTWTFTVEAIPPVVSITSPADGAMFDVGDDVEITAEASDEDSASVSVEFFVNGSSVGESDTAPYSVTVSGLSDGFYALKAVATDSEGLTGQASVTIQVGEPVTTTPEEGLVAHYTFDDNTANDSSGNGNDGTLDGTASIVGDPEHGLVLSLDGGGKVDLGDPESMQLEGEITVTAWINIMGGSGNRNIVNKGHDDSGLPTGYRREFTMRVDASTPANYDFGTWESGRDPGDQNATIPVPDEDLAGNWVHLAGTAAFDSETSTYTWNLYRNGVLVNTSEPFDTGMFPVNFGWAIGARGGVDDVQRGFVGMIDDVRIYDRALSAQEIAALASRIIWINEVESEAGQEYQDLLKNAGYQVSVRMFTNPTTEEQAELNAADLVIISRKTNSGTYNNQTWDETITTPLILMTPYLARNSRWVWVDGTSIVNADPSLPITADVREHPLFAGMDTTGGTAGFWYTDPIDRGTNITGQDPILDGGTLLASQNGNIISAEWPAGSVAVGPRLLFNSGSQEPSGGTTADSGKYDLTETGAMAFLNAVAYMIGQGGATGPGGPAFDSIVLHGNGTISISWTGSATLESSTAVTGPYAPVADAANPYTVNDPQGTLFFRLVP